MSWEFRDYQVKYGDIAKNILDSKKMVYLGMEERTGKTGTAIYVGNKVKAKRVLIVTKAAKKTMDGWKEQLAELPTQFDYVLTSYHSAHKVKGKFDLVILDESHNYISAYPKPGKIWKEMYKLVYGLPIIYMSATPHPQGYQMLYHQFKLSKWSPWAAYSTYYSWYKTYAELDEAEETEKIYISGRMIETYKRVQVKRIKACVDHLFVTVTRKQLGFKQEPSDKVHYITLSPGAKKACQLLAKEKVLHFTPASGIRRLYLADSPIALRTGLHQIEGGTLLTRTDTGKRQPNILKEDSKIQYILEHFGDTKNLAIMYNFKAEEDKLRQYFKKAEILQATSNAEGVDLHEMAHLVIYSQDYSAGKHTQRRARQANMNREDPIIVHHLIVKGGLSDQVYRTVCLNKLNFIDSRFHQGELNYE